MLIFDFAVLLILLVAVCVTLNERAKRERLDARVRALERDRRDQWEYGGG